MSIENEIARFLIEDTGDLKRDEMLAEMERRFGDVSEDEFNRGIYNAVVIERQDAVERGDPYNVSDALARLSKTSKREVLDRFWSLLGSQA